MKAHIQSIYGEEGTTHGPSVIPKPGDANYNPPAHFDGAVYYTAVVCGGGQGEVLAADIDGNEFPAEDGYYFQQWDKLSDHGGKSIDGYFGPYDSYEDMPDYVRANFADDFLNGKYDPNAEDETEPFKNIE